MVEELAQMLGISVAVLLGALGMATQDAEANERATSLIRAINNGNVSEEKIKQAAAQKDSVTISGITLSFR